MTFHDMEGKNDNFKKLEYIDIIWKNDITIMTVSQYHHL